MIRKLMTSTALVALLSAGAVNMAVAADTATTTKTAPAKTETSAENKLVPEKPTLATAFVGRSVYASKDPESETIGDVNDLIIGDDGAITDAVIGVGGFLGIGEKNVAVPFNELQVVERDGDIRLIYAATREQLEAAPAVDLAKYEPAARYSEQQAAMNSNNATDNAMQAPPADGVAATPTPGVGMTGDSPLAAADAIDAGSADQMAADDTSMANHHEAGFLSPDAGQIRASILMGKAVYSAEHDEVGEISDLVLDKDGGTRVALVDVGGFLGVGEKTVAIPFDELAFAKAEGSDEPQVTIDMNRDQLEQLPPYERSVGATAAKDTKVKSADKMAADTDMAAADSTATDQPMTADATAENMAATDAKEPNPITTGAINTDFVAQEVSASDLMGARVYGANDSDLGEISDIVFDESGQIDAVVIDVGGFLGIGEKPVAVDFDSLNIRTDQAGTLMVSVNASEDQLKNAPAYDVSMK